MYKKWRSGEFQYVICAFQGVTLEPTHTKAVKSSTRIKTNQKDSKIQREGHLYNILQYYRNEVLYVFSSLEFQMLLKISAL